MTEYHFYDRSDTTLELIAKHVRNGHTAVLHAHAEEAECLGELHWGYMGNKVTTYYASKGLTDGQPARP